MATRNNKTNASALLADLKECGFLLSYCEVGEGAFTVTKTQNWGALALECSGRAGGQWRAKPNGVNWICGSKSVWFLDRESLSAIESAREVSLLLTGIKGGFSVASNARHCLKWAVGNCDTRIDVARFLGQTGLGFHSCEPGVFPDAKHYDIRSCYWQLLQRLPALRWTLGANNRLIPLRETPDATLRLSEMFLLLETHKSMRNSVWGSALGSIEPGVFYCNGERRISGGFAGSNQTAALIVGRMAWELCRDAAHATGAHYAQTDCVITTENRAPDLWDKYGLQYRQQYEGEADIRAQHVYKIGGQVTKFFRKRDTFTEAAPIPALEAKRAYTVFLA